MAKKKKPTRTDFVVDSSLALAWCFPDEHAPYPRSVLDSLADVRAFVPDQVEALEDRVGAAEVPALADPLLGGHRCHVVAEQGGHPPGLGDVPVQAVRLVLRQHDDAQVAGVHQVAQRDVDEPVDPSERNRRLGPVGGQGHQSLPLTARQDDPAHLHEYFLVRVGRWSEN